MTQTPDAAESWTQTWPLAALWARTSPRSQVAIQASPIRLFLSPLTSPDPPLFMCTFCSFLPHLSSLLILVVPSILPTQAGLLWVSSDPPVPCSIGWGLCSLLTLYLSILYSRCNQTLKHLRKPHFLTAYLHTPSLSL